jgi:hypothetical protein
MTTRKKSKGAATPKEEPAPKPETVLVLRCVDANRRAYNGFQWPESGPVEAPDWEATQECGHGLHGWLRGVGDPNVATIHNDSLWQIVEVVAADVIDLGGKVKYPRGVVLYTGDKAEAINRIQAAYPHVPVIYGTATAGYRGTATAGNYGTATAGEGGTATAGEGGTATAGEGGILEITRWDGKRYRKAVGYVGEEGILADTKYRLNANGIFEVVK